MVVMVVMDVVFAILAIAMEKKTGPTKDSLDSSILPSSVPAAQGFIAVVYHPKT